MYILNGGAHKCLDCSSYKKVKHCSFDLTRRHKYFFCLFWETVMSTVKYKKGMDIKRVRYSCVTKGTS